MLLVVCVFAMFPFLYFVVCLDIVIIQDG